MVSAVRPALLAVVAGALGCVAMLLGSGPAAAHTAFASSDPAEGEEVAVLDAVTVRFTEEVATDFASLTVTGPGGERVDDGEALVGGATLTTTVTPVEAGQHELDYRVVSADGHPVTGTVTFTYAGAAAEPAPTAEPEPAGDPEPTADAQPVDESEPAAPTTAMGPATGEMGAWMGVLAGLGALAVAATVVVRVWRARQADTTPTRRTEGDGRAQDDGRARDD